MLYFLLFLFIIGEELNLATQACAHMPTVKESNFKPTKIHRPKNALITGFEIKWTY